MWLGESAPRPRRHRARAPPDPLVGRLPDAARKPGSDFRAPVLGFRSGSLCATSVAMRRVAYCLLSLVAGCGARTAVSIGAWDAAVAPPDASDDDASIPPSDAGPPPPPCQPVLAPGEVRFRVEAFGPAVFGGDGTLYAPVPPADGGDGVALGAFDGCTGEEKWRHTVVTDSRAAYCTLQAHLTAGGQVLLSRIDPTPAPPTPRCEGGAVFAFTTDGEPLGEVAPEPGERLFLYSVLDDSQIAIGVRAGEHRPRASFPPDRTAARRRGRRDPTRNHAPARRRALQLRRLAVRSGVLHHDPVAHQRSPAVARGSAARGWAATLSSLGLHSSRPRRAPRLLRSLGRRVRRLPRAGRHANRSAHRDGPPLDSAPADVHEFPYGLVGAPTIGCGGRVHLFVDPDGPENPEPDGSTRSMPRCRRCGATR